MSITIQEKNLRLWERLAETFSSKLDDEHAHYEELRTLTDTRENDIADPLYREAMGQALRHQEGRIRYAESQIAVARAMYRYWSIRMPNGAGRAAR